jgi:hypothetical protein
MPLDVLGHSASPHNIAESLILSIEKLENGKRADLESFSPQPRPGSEKTE